jgi:hypothetical protein
MVSMDISKKDRSGVDITSYFGPEGLPFQRYVGDENGCCKYGIHTFKKYKKAQQNGYKTTKIDEKRNPSHP